MVPCDVSGAFLESDDLEKPLYAAQPKEGLPGLDDRQLVMEVVERLVERLARS